MSGGDRKTAGAGPVSGTTLCPDITIDRQVYRQDSNLEDQAK
jgi:hypothetical protein